MIMFGFSVHDKAVGAFLPLFFARSKGEAIRSFSSALKDEKHQFRSSPGDYCLYKICEFDDNSGIVTSDTPERVLTALEALPTE